MTSNSTQVKRELNEKWIKASVLGTIWAASEIVFGSFLHNLKIPFSGNILTAIGLVVLISVSYIWHEKGLFWRAGLICALMKTMSPSAVIFGPMIAILAEAFILELSVRILGRTWLGFVVGSILAMSWNLFQKIANFILFYGFNIVDLYTDLVRYAQKQLHIQFDVVWLPILILLLAYSIFGLISAIIGIKTGRKIGSQPMFAFTPTQGSGVADKFKRSQLPFNYSVGWLVADIISIVGALAILNYAPLPVWSFLLVVIITVWVIRYKRALRQLSKPKFWVFFVVITMLTAFVFSTDQPGISRFYSGLLTGLQMNFRAAIIIVGFSVLGTELYNPKIRNFFLKTSVSQLPLALELSFESLPMVIAATPDFRTVVKNPVMALAQIVAQTELRLSEIRNKLNPNNRVFIISGGVGEGKTSCVEAIVKALQVKNISFSGIYTPRVMENGNTSGYNVVDLSSGEHKCFLRLEGNTGQQKIGRYYIMEQGLRLGVNSLKASLKITNEIVIIDEAGRLELDGKGWATCISYLLNTGNCRVLLTVRDRFVDDVIHNWNIKQCLVYKLSENDIHSVRDRFMKDIQNS